MLSDSAKCLPTIRRAQIFTTYLMYFNSLLNPFLYALSFPSIRSAMLAHVIMWRASTCRCVSGSSCTPAAVAIDATASPNHVSERRSVMATTTMSLPLSSVTTNGHSKMAPLAAASTPLVTIVTRNGVVAVEPSSDEICEAAV